MIDETFRAKRLRAIELIKNSLEAIDKYNLAGDDAKAMDMQKLIGAIIDEFHVSWRLAEEWAKEAIKIYEQTHKDYLRQESIIRNVNK